MTPARQVICTKVRDGDKRIVQIKEGDPKGRHVVIVDDLVQSGGTLIECHAVLAKAGAKHGELSLWPCLAISHLALLSCLAISCS